MVSLHPSVLAPCPRCGADVWTFCWDCRAYVSDLSAEKPHSVGAVAPEATPQKASVVLQDNRTEKEIEAAVIFALETLGFKAWKVSQPRATMQAEGLGDLFITGHGRSTWCEVKRPLTGVPSKDRDRAQSTAQEKFQAAVEANGGAYILVRSEAEAIEWARSAITPEYVSAFNRAPERRETT